MLCKDYIQNIYMKNKKNIILPDPLCQYLQIPQESFHDFYMSNKADIHFINDSYMDAVFK